MKKNIKSILLFLFFLLSVFNLIQVKNVSGATTNRIIVTDTDQSILSDGGYCYFGWDGLVCSYSDYVNSSYTTYSLMPTIYNGNPILTWDLINVNISYFLLNRPDLVVNGSVKLGNITDYIPLENYSVYYDNRVLEPFPNTQQQNLIYEKTTNETYVLETTINQLNAQNQYETDTPVYVIFYLFEFNSSIEFQFDFNIRLNFLIEITYDSGGWDSFSDTLISFIPASIIYLVLLYGFGQRFGLLGGGLACVLTMIILITLNDSSLIPLIIMQLGLAIIFFMMAYKKSNLNNRSEI